MHTRRTALLAAVAAGVLTGVLLSLRASRRPEVRVGAFTNGIEYAAIGRGPRTLLFLPGGPGTVPFTGIWGRLGAGMFRRWADAGFTVWRLRRRSDMPAGHTVEDMADDVAAVIDEAFGGRVDVVVGLSYGGPIALLLAARHPEKVGRVALIASSATITDEGREIDRRYGEALGHGHYTGAARAMLEELRPAGPQRPWLERLLAPLVGRVLAGSGYHLPDVLVETRAEMDVDAGPALNRITAPVLIIAGDQDIFFTPEIVAETAELIADCTVIRYAGRGHGQTASDPRVAGDVLAFAVRGVEPGHVRPGPAPR